MSSPTERGRKRGRKSDPIMPREPDSGSGSGSGNKRPYKQGCPKIPDNVDMSYDEYDEYDKRIKLYRDTFNEMIVDFYALVKQKKEEKYNFQELKTSVSEFYKKLTSPSGPSNPSKDAGGRPTNIEKIYSESYLDTILTKQDFYKILLKIKDITDNDNKVLADLTDEELVKLLVAEELYFNIKDCFEDSDGFKCKIEESLKYQYNITFFKNFILDINVKTILQRQAFSVLKRYNFPTQVQSVRTNLEYTLAKTELKQQMQKYKKSNQNFGIPYTNKEIKEIFAQVQTEKSRKLENLISQARTATPPHNEETKNKIDAITKLEEALDRLISEVKESSTDSPIIVIPLTIPTTSRNELQQKNITLSSQTGNSIILKLPGSEKTYRINKTSSGLFINETDIDGTLTEYDFHLSLFKEKGGPFDDYVDAHITFNFTNPTNGVKTTFPRLFLAIPVKFSNDYSNNLQTLISPMGITRGTLQEQIDNSNYPNIRTDTMEKIIKKNGEILSDFKEIISLLNFIANYNKHSGTNVGSLARRATAEMATGGVSIKPKEPKTPKESKKPKEPIKPKTPEEPIKPKEVIKPKTPKEPKEPKTPKEPTKPKEPKKPKTSKVI